MTLQEKFENSVIGEGHKQHIERALVRGTHFDCEMLNVSGTPDEVQLYFRIGDPLLAFKNGGHDTVFTGELFWYPEKNLLGIANIKSIAHARNGTRSNGVGHVLTRNIFDVARLLGAKRIELMASGTTGPLFWAKCGAKLQEKSVSIPSGMYGEQIWYWGADQGYDLIADRIIRLHDDGKIPKEKKDHILELARSPFPERALWAVADDKAGFRSENHQRNLTLGQYCLTEWYNPFLPRYAARFLLDANEADEAHTGRMNTYLHKDLVLDQERYALAVHATINKDPKTYAPLVFERWREATGLYLDL